jgi:hypothetical protein
LAAGNHRFTFDDLQLERYGQRAFLETRKHLGDERADKHFREQEKRTKP